MYPFEGDEEPRSSRMRRGSQAQRGMPATYPYPEPPGLITDYDIEVLNLDDDKPEPRRNSWRIPDPSPGRPTVAGRGNKISSSVAIPKGGAWQPAPVEVKKGVNVRPSSLLPKEKRGDSAIYQSLMGMFNSSYAANGETERNIKINDHEFNHKFNYAKNYIKTSKYTFYNFLPFNLFEQFQRLANFYFLCLLVLQLIPVISSLTWVTTAVPLIGVLAITAAKDAYDDFQRHRSDSQVNNRISKVLRNGHLVEEVWSKVMVGDVIRMVNDQFVAADLFLISSSEPNGLCYIETSELDGETNLKVKQSLPETSELGDEVSQISAFNGEIICEPPNNQLNKFEGTLIYGDKKFSLDNDKILLRGCILRNTKWCYGVVVFAGKDTKLMQNSGKTKFKRTSIDRLLNFIILGIVFFLLAMCLFCTIASGIWETFVGQYFRIYLPWDTLIPKDPQSGATVIALLIFFSYAIVLNTVVPISLYVSDCNSFYIDETRTNIDEQHIYDAKNRHANLFSGTAVHFMNTGHIVEVIRLAQSFLINWDDQMTYGKIAAKSRTTTLNEELGQIEFIFSDKTGTLTQNIMTFNKCSVGGRSYGDILDPRTGEIVDVSEATPSINFSKNPYYESTFKFYDKELLEHVNGGNADCGLFFKLLSLCHTVMAEDKNGKLEYQAQSPDEAALVSSARNFGYVFLSRTPRSITINARGEMETYELLCILDFNNVRKRMSVILKKDGRIKLYCKGADSIIYERLKGGQDNLRDITQDHLNKFAGEGLRTLVLATKDLDEAYFQKWKQRYEVASTTMESREEKLDELFEEIEKDLVIAGATAIEDKLQDGVPACIANLSLAGIKIWVLTGDKQETAINIGYSCQLLTDEMVDVYIVDGNTAVDVEGQLQKYNMEMNKLKATPARPQTSLSVLSFSFYSDDPQAEAELRDTSGAAGGFALVINGHSLVWALNPKMEELFLEVASQCKSVICCRVTPLQKALVVDLVKRHKKAVTLAVGDGANDVSMIKTAHIGVGISGEEGLQAVLASDYSIAQFRYLERLLLVHGRWSYIRMSKFLRYFFYKNFAFTLCHFWFAFFVGFSAQTVFDPVFISVYNLFYTSLPVLALGALDQDVNDRNSINFPLLYTPGIKNALFNKSEFGRSAVHGFLTSCVLFFVPFGAYYNGMDREGRSMADHQTFGAVVATILVIVVTMQMCLDTAYWTVFNHVTIWGSVVFYFCLQLFYNYMFSGNYVGTIVKALSEPMFYFCTLLTLVVMMLPVMAWRFYWVDVHPTLSDKVRYKQRLDSKLALRKSELAMKRTPSARRSRRSLRSGYAFSHQEGFGRLITSGKIMNTRNANKALPGDQAPPTAGQGANGAASLITAHYRGVSIAPTQPSIVEV